MRITELPGDPTVVVANLPYNVSVPVILHLLETFPSIQRGLVMVQAEVGERIAAGPGSKIYGSPSAKAAWYGDFALAGSVSRQVFWPVPNVDSVLVKFERHAEPGTPGGAARDLRSHRRRVPAAPQDAPPGARAGLRRRRPSPASRRPAIDPTQRGEQLTVDDFLAIARAATLAP